MSRPGRFRLRARRVTGVFLGPVETAGYFGRLRMGLERVGVRTTYADLEDHPFAYPEAPPPTTFERIGRLAGRRLRRASGAHERVFWKAASLAARGGLLARALATCDTFVFGSGQTLFGLRELPLLRLLGKRVIIVFFGTDVRPSYLDGIEANAAGATPQTLAIATRAKRERIARVERYATAVVSHGPTSQLLSRPFAEWLKIGIPTPAREVADLSDARRFEPLRVLHAPSHAGVKGTARIREVIGRATATGVALEYRELQHATNDRVQEELAWCDVVIDQLYSDTPMGVLASEAAAAGRACIVGSLDWAAIIDAFPSDVVPPSIRIEPDALESTLRRIAADRAAVLEAGARAREFVRGRWSPEAVARRYLALADGSASPSWYTSPTSIRYAAGAGLNAERLSAIRAALDDAELATAEVGRHG